MDVPFVAGRIAAVPKCRMCDAPAEFYADANSLEVNLCRGHTLGLIQALVAAVNGADRTQAVVVEVRRGVAEVTQKPAGIAVFIKDHDSEAAGGNGITECGVAETI